MISLSYQSATSGTRAREEVTKFLRRFGCESIGFMDQFDTDSVLLASTHNHPSAGLILSHEQPDKKTQLEPRWIKAQFVRKFDDKLGRVEWQSFRKFETMGRRKWPS